MIYTFYKQWGNSIYVRYKKGFNSISKKFDGYQPSLYTPSNTSNIETKSIFGQTLQKTKFKDISSAKDFISTYKNTDIEIHGNQNYGNQFIIDLLNGESPKYNPTEIHGLFIDIEVFAPVMPKPNNPIYPITAITAIDSITQEFTVFLLKNDDTSWKKTKSELEYINDIKISFKDYVNEKDLLLDFIEFFRTNNPDYTSGWNSSGFDMPYIVKRCDSLLGERTTKRLSPFEKIDKKETQDAFNNDVLTVDIWGVPDLDYQKLYKKHTYTPRINYKLDTIAECELGYRKLSYEESGSLFNLYKEDIQKYIDYNIQDTKIILDLNKKLGLIELTFTLAYYTLSNYTDTLGTVKLWEQLMAKFLFKKDMVPPPRKQYTTTDFDGAYVHEPVIGFHESIISVDLNSLYPHIKQQLNIGQETFVPYHKLPQEVYDTIIKPNYTFDDILNNRVDTNILKKYNLALSPSFSFYDITSMSVISEINRELYSLRKVHKKKMLSAEQEVVDFKKLLKQKHSKEIEDTLKQVEIVVSIENNTQLAIKILLNSGYGAIGNSSYLYYKIENAESITSMGKFVNQYTMINLQKYLQKVLNTDETLWIAGDTDSGYIQLHPLIKNLNINWKDNKDKCESILDEFTKSVIQPKIDELSNNIHNYLNSFEQRMFWEREVIAESAIFVAKKRYIMKVWNSEGVRYSDPKYKIVGLDSVKSSTPPWAQKMLKDCYKLAIDSGNESIIKYVKECKKNFYTFSLNQIAIPTGVNGIEKYYDSVTVYKKGAQAHVKAALYHNKILKDLNISKISPIQSGSKILYLHLKTQNPYKIEVIGFENGLPNEFCLDNYIDKETIFEKGFLSFLQNFLNALNWSYEERVTLDL